MISNFSTVTYPFEMSQLVCSLGRFFVLLLVLLADSGRAFNITRHTTGDVFENRNPSQSCNSSGAVCVVDRENQSFCTEKDCCYCVCGRRTPTYLLSEGNCTTEAYLMSVLNSTQGCDHRMIVANGISGHLGCSQELLTTLNTRRPGNTSLFFCRWDKGVLPLHYQLAKKLLKCDILAQSSRYLDNGSWVTMPRASHVGLKNLQVDIQQDPLFVDNNKLILKWTADIGPQYDGFIFSLGLKCHGKGKVLNSCLHFKKSGSLTDLMPVLPHVTKPTRVSSTSVQRTTPRIVGKSPTSVTKRTPTPRDVNVTTSFQGHLHSNTLVVVLASLAGALFVLLTCVGVLFVLRKRKRRYQTRKGSSKVNNPVYDRGASETLKLAKISHTSGEDEEEGPEYQPLVENTKPRERIDSMPGYRTLSFDKTPNQQKGPGPGVRSSNYLSLIKDDVEEGSDYQTLVKHENHKTLEPVEEEKIPDYQELQERTDSEDTLSGSCVSSVESVSDYEEPPENVVAENSTKNQYLPGKEHFNDLLMENDYDEPEGVIAISDDEKDLTQETPENPNFHAYAEPENSE